MSNIAPEVLDIQVTIATMAMNEAFSFLPEEASLEDKRDFWLMLSFIVRDKLKDANETFLQDRT